MSARRVGKHRRLRIFSSLVLAVLILGLPAGIYLWGRSANVFRVHAIVLTGMQHASQQRALTMLRARFLNRNLALISSGEVRTALRTYPYVHDVRVEHDFPDTLRIAVTEYKPVACLLTPAGWYAINAQGYVIAVLPATAAKTTTTTTAPAASSLPAAASATAANGASATAAAGAAITGDTLAPSLAKLLVVGPPVRLRPAVPALFTTAAVREGQVVGDQQVRVAASLLGALPTTLRTATAYVRVTAAGGVLVVLRSGVQVDFGDSSLLEAKVLALSAVMDYYARKRVVPAYVDVSVPDRPLATPKLPT
ncbi:MAG: cell division protein FtsQ/DivIB [Thermoleophilia bacterium]